VTDTTLETPQVPTGGDQGSARPSHSGSPRSLLNRYTWWTVALGIVAFSGLVILVTDTRPGYDPYGWLDWGYQTLRLSLDLGGAPSWKPFTYVFALPYSIFGHYALWLWMLTAVSMSLGGAVFGGRIAYRVTASESDSRWPAIVAAIVGGAAVLGIQQYFHYLLSDQSDPMLVTVCLAAIDCYLGRHYRWAYCLGILASLGRPEVWPFVFLFTIWAWRKVPSMRWMLYTGPFVVAFLWFGVPTITNHRPNIAGQLALRSPRELHQNKIAGIWDRFTALNILPVEIAALIAAGLALLRRSRTVVALAGCVLLWVVIEIAFALHGFPGVPRYLFEAAGLTGVLAGIGVGWLVLDASRIHRALPRWIGAPVAVVLVASMVPSAISQARLERKDIRHEQARTKEINRLSAIITALGGPRHVAKCGRPVLNVEYVSIMGWYMHRNTGTIGYRPKIELHNRRYPIVIFSALPNGWGVRPYRTPARLTSYCSNLTALYVPTARHPNGVLVPK
jgi:hypothetical protein